MKIKKFLYIVVPLLLSLITVVVGCQFAGLSYYVVATLLIIYALVAFFLYYEKGKHRERELVMMSIMCAIAVVSRAAFIWIPHFKPMAAIIMIAGIGFGAQSGFLTGTLAILLSNLIFGQGPWTPWQMIAFGFCGLIMGALADTRLIERHNLSKSKLLLLATVGALIVLLIAGPFLDIYALTSMVDVYTFESVAGILLAGVPVNAIQAAATFLTLLLLGNPLLNAIYRARVKYGLTDD